MQSRATQQNKRLNKQCAANTDHFEASQKHPVMWAAVFLLGVHTRCYGALFQKATEKILTLSVAFCCCTPDKSLYRTIA